MPFKPEAVRSDAMEVPSMFISWERIGSILGSMGIEPGRDEKAGGVGALLMNVIDDFGMPDVLNLRDDGAGFGLGKDVPVAIVVVADVLLIELGR